MLKLGDQLWTYSPQTDRTVTISGHMLRQSVMGSDLSYEDMMEDPLLQNTYTAELGGEGEILRRPVWKLDLTAKVNGLAYESRAIWVDQERFIILKEERYARSGRLLKTAEVREVRQFDGRWVASSVVFVDELRNGGGTEFVVESIEFDIEIPDHVFSRASLRR
jgi:outer membrane lipoprotein-sorting protein